MRIPTELRVKALIRRCSSAGVAAVIVRTGDADAGMLFIKIRLLDGTAKLLGPAPAGLSLDASPDDGLPRLAPHLDVNGTAEATVDAYMMRQTEYDPDLWLVEIDDRKGRSFLED